MRVPQVIWGRGKRKDPSKNDSFAIKHRPPEVVDPRKHVETCQMSVL